MKTKQIIRKESILFNEEYPKFKIKTLQSKKGDGRWFLYFKTSDILKSIGVKDSVSSLINPKSSTGAKRFHKLYEALKKRGTYKRAFYFSAPEMKYFITNYKPRGEEKRELWQCYVDWIQTVIREHLDKNPIKTKSPERKIIKNTLTSTAKMLGIGVKKDLIPFLIEQRFLYRQRGVLLPFEIKVRQKIFTVREVKIDKLTHEGIVPQVFVTKKGHEKIKELWNNPK